MRKKVLSFAIAIIMLLSVTACGNESSSEESSSAISSENSSETSNSSVSENSENSEEESSEEEWPSSYDTLDRSNLRTDFTTNEFLIGSWVSFYSFEKDDYQYQLDQMKQLGFNFNIFPKNFGGEIDAETIAEIEAEYASRDMYYMMFGDMNPENVELNASIAKDMEHCIGYHIVDEPRRDAFDSVASICKAFRKADNTRYPFVNLFPSYAGSANLGGDYSNYIKKFIRAVRDENMEYLSHDFYPMNEGGTNYNIFSDMEVLRKAALEYGGLRTHAFPQSTQWTGMRMPTIDDMRWNVYGYLAYGFKGLSWFNLVCPGSADGEGEGFKESIIYRDGEIHDKQLFEDFIALNQEIVSLGDTLVDLDCLHAYHTKGEINGVEMIPENWIVSPDADSNLIVSHMTSRTNGDLYVMLFNKEYALEQKVSARVNNVESLSYLNPFTGEWEDVTVENGTFNESFRAGEGKLYRINMKA